MKKVWQRLVWGCLVVLAGIFLSYYGLLLREGWSVYSQTKNSIDNQISKYPEFYETVFGEIFNFALVCELQDSECVSQTRAQFDTLSEQLVEPDREAQDRLGYHLIRPKNSMPVYFIKLLPDGQLAKLFFSGDLKIEQVDNREERMVVALLQGKRQTLYGPYFDQEVFDIDNGKRKFYDLKPNYLKDLYSQMEVIVPYYQDGRIVGALVYLHGE